MIYLFVLIVTVVLAFALQPKIPEPTPATLSEIDIPTANQGKPIPKVFGQIVVQSPNIVWYGDLGYNKVTSEGGK